MFYGIVFSLMARIFKAGIYFSHYECFGPASRVMAVGEVFKERFPSGNLFFIQAGIPQPLSKIDQLGDIYSLPSAFMDRRYFMEAINETGSNVVKRHQKCEEIITLQCPDLFITESFPLGHEECCHELTSSLVKASAQGATLWAVAVSPIGIGINIERWSEVLKLYKQVFILSPFQEIENIADSFSHSQDRQRYLDFFKENAQKIIFAGYLLPMQETLHIGEEVSKNLYRPPVPQGACQVAVIRGSGVVNPKMIAQAIRASDLLGEEYYLTVVAGPSTTPQEWYFFSTLVAQKKVNNLVLLLMVGDYEGLIKKSDVCVSQAGYHTAVMLLKHRKKAIVIPFEGYESMPFHEQPARAVMLKEMIGARILTIQHLTADMLTMAIKNTAACPENTTPIPEDWLMGRDVLDKALASSFPS